MGSGLGHIQSLGQAWLGLERDFSCGENAQSQAESLAKCYQPAGGGGGGGAGERGGHRTQAPVWASGIHRNLTGRENEGHRQI